MITEARKRWLEENKESLKEYQKQYKKNNKEKLTELNKEWHKANPDKNKTYKTKYRKENKNILNAKGREYYYRTIEKQREKSKLYSQNNPEKSNERSKRWIKNNPEKAMFNRAKQRAKQKEIEFTITLKDISIPSHCPILDIPLFTSTEKMCDNSPSLDRINNNKGYIKGNVIVISHRANLIKSVGTIDEHVKIVMFLKSYKNPFNYP